MCCFPLRQVEIHSKANASLLAMKIIIHVLFAFPSKIQV